MSGYDWSRFSTRININADPHQIYAAWNTPGGLERWFLRVAEFSTPDKRIRGSVDSVVKGDTYRWLWHGYDDGVVEEGTILEANGEDLVRFTFAGDCIVTILIKQEGSETVVELTQEHIPLDEHARVSYHLGCLTGWTFYMANLKSILEGGVDLRNKNPNLRTVINA